jgi:hypothetical protein
LYEDSYEEEQNIHLNRLFQRIAIVNPSQGATAAIKAAAFHLLMDAIQTRPNKRQLQFLFPYVIYAHCDTTSKSAMLTERIFSLLFYGVTEKHVESMFLKAVKPPDKPNRLLSFLCNRQHN